MIKDKDTLLRVARIIDPAAFMPTSRQDEVYPTFSQNVAIQKAREIFDLLVAGEESNHAR